MILWKTRLLRPARPGRQRRDRQAVVGYVRAHLPARDPPLYADLGGGARGRAAAAELLPHGSWVGGDRDGNPNVTADSLRAAFRRQAQSRRCPLPRGGSPARRRAAASTTPGRLAAAEGAGGGSPDRPAHRLDEPYRRALVGHLRAPRGHRPSAERRSRPLPATAVAARPTPRPTSSCADLETISARSSPTAAPPPAAAGCRDLIRAVDVLRLPPGHRSTCARTPTCTSAWSPSCSTAAGVAADYAALDEEAAGRAAARRARPRRPLRVALRRLRGGDASGAGHRCAPRAEVARPLRPRRIRTYIISKTDRRLRPAGGLRPAEGGRPAARRATGRVADAGRPAVRDHRRPARRAGDHARLARAAGRRALLAALRRVRR